MKDNKVFNFNIYAFFIALFIGFLYVYISTPKIRTIIKYPTPYNYDKSTYQTDTGDCFKFRIKEVKCTKDYIEQPIT